MLTTGSFANSIAFGMWWMIIPHIAVVSALLLAGNNPNTLEGIVTRPSSLQQKHHMKVFALVYESRYRPAWIWARGRCKKIWIEKLIHEARPGGLREKLTMRPGDWAIIGISAYSLILIPSALAFLTSYYTPKVGLSCRSMTFLIYMICQICLSFLEVWDIHTTHIDRHGNVQTPASRLPWMERLQQTSPTGYILQSIPHDAVSSSTITTDTSPAGPFAFESAPFLNTSYDAPSAPVNSSFLAAPRSASFYALPATTSPTPSLSSATSLSASPSPAPHAEPYAAPSLTRRVSRILSAIASKPITQSEDWQPYIWYSLVGIFGALAIFTAIGGTMMQIIGVYRNCLCDISIGQWAIRMSPYATFDISTFTGQDIHLASTWWKGTGIAATAFLGFASFIGWWYQKRLRYRFKKIIEDIAKDTPPVPPAARIEALSSV